MNQDISNLRLPNTFSIKQKKIIYENDGSSFNNCYCDTTTIFVFVLLYTIRLQLINFKKIVKNGNKVIASKNNRQRQKGDKKIQLYFI